MTIKLGSKKNKEVFFVDTMENLLKRAEKETTAEELQILLDYKKYYPEGAMGAKSVIKMAKNSLMNR